MDVLAVLDTPGSEEMIDRANRSVGKITITSGFRLERTEMLRSLRHYLRGAKPRTTHY